MSRYPKDAGEHDSDTWQDDGGKIRINMEGKCVFWNDCFEDKCPCDEQNIEIDGQTTLEEFIA